MATRQENESGNQDPEVPSLLAYAEGVVNGSDIFTEDTQGKLREALNLNVYAPKGNENSPLYRALELARNYLLMFRRNRAPIFAEIQAWLQEVDENFNAVDRGKVKDHVLIGMGAVGKAFELQRGDSFLTEGLNHLSRADVQGVLSKIPVAEVGGSVIDRIANNQDFPDQQYNLKPVVLELSSKTNLGHFIEAGALAMYKIGEKVPLPDVAPGSDSPSGPQRRW